MTDPIKQQVEKLVGYTIPERAWTRETRSLCKQLLHAMNYNMETKLARDSILYGEGKIPDILGKM